MELGYPAFITEVKPVRVVESLELQDNANINEEKYSDASYQSKEESCVDDLGLADSGSQGVKQLTEECEKMPAHGKIKVEKLIYLEKISKEDVENLADPCEEIPKVEDKHSLPMEDRKKEGILNNSWEIGCDEVPQNESFEFPGGIWKKVQMLAMLFLRGCETLWKVIWPLCKLVILTILFLMDASIAASSYWEKGPTFLRENVEF